MPIEILQESFPFIRPNHVRHTRGGVMNFLHPLFLYPGKQNVFVRKVDGDLPLKLAALLDELSIDYATGVYDVLDLITMTREVLGAIPP